MKIPLSHKITLRAAPLLAGMFWLAGQTFGGQATATQQPGAPRSGNVEDVEERVGPFSIASQSYTVVLHEKRIPGLNETAFARALAAIEIQDAGRNTVYQKTFRVSVAMEQERFDHSVSAAAELVTGKTGAGLVIHYREDTATPPPGASQIQESWQLFGLVNGELTLFGKPALIGQAGAGGPFMGVVMRAANGTATVIARPDTFALQVWTGYFFVFAPLRVDWSHGGLAQGQRCVERQLGKMREVGCPMRAEAIRKPSAETYTFARLFTEANENMGDPQHVVMQKGSKVEILGASAIVNWNGSGEMIRRRCQTSGCTCASAITRDGFTAMMTSQQLGCRQGARRNEDSLDCDCCRNTSRGRLLCMAHAARHPPRRHEGACCAINNNRGSRYAGGATILKPYRSRTSTAIKRIDQDAWPVSHWRARLFRTTAHKECWDALFRRTG